MSRLILLTVLWTSCPNALLAQSVGRVVGQSGGPLAGVKVTDQILHQETTDSEGRFSLTNVVRFTLPGYEPATKVLSETSDLQIVLKQSTNSIWQPPVCNPPREIAFHLIVITGPKGKKLKYRPSDDVDGTDVRYGKYVLQHAFGSSWSWGLPHESFFNGIRTMQERDLLFHPDVRVAEYRGARSDGSYFRWIGTLGETLEYDHASKEAAAYFDKIIDSLCWSHEP